MTTYLESQDTDRQMIVRELAQHLHASLGINADSAHGIAEAAFDHLDGDHRMFGRYYDPERETRVTVRAAGNRTVSVHGHITGHEIGVHDATVSWMEITRARVHDTGELDEQ